MTSGTTAGVCRLSLRERYPVMSTSFRGAKGDYTCRPFESGYTIRATWAIDSEIILGRWLNLGGGGLRIIYQTKKI